jgi:hypothetical protein
MAVIRKSIDVNNLKKNSQPARTRVRHEKREVAPARKLGFAYPAKSDLTAALTSVFQTNGSRQNRLHVVEREPAEYSTTFPCEIVTCRLSEDNNIRMFCKYNGGVDYTGHGHRGRVEYEISVYRDILSRLPLHQPKFYGGWVEPRTRQHWLFLEYLPECLRIGKLDDAEVMKQAARWIAQFHSLNEPRAGSKRHRFLKKYDEEYYLGWVRRTSEFAGSLHRRYPWLHALCEQSERLLAPLVEMPPTVIHGEYYSPNVLFHRGSVCPVDWESAAIANGLIDLASLTEGWSEEIISGCRREYTHTRWPGGAPAGFEEALNAARLYMNFRWLGDDRHTTHSKGARGHFDRLAAVGQEMGVI